MKIVFPIAFAFGIGMTAAMLLLIIVITFVKPNNLQHLQDVFGLGFISGLFLLGFSTKEKEV